MAASNSHGHGFPGEADSGPAGRALRVLAVVGLHAGLIAWIADVAPPPAPTRAEPLRMEVRTIVAVVDAPAAVQPPAPPKPAPPKQPPPKPAPPKQPPPKAAPVPPKAPPPREPVPVTPVAEPPRSASTEVAVAASAAAPAEPAPAAPPMAPAPAAEPPPLVAARFDAEYLHNPAPSYPPLSRRRGEQGTVMLMVKVSAEGVAQHVEVHESCGYPRLDAAALKAVRAWRFVPARRGDAAVAASVLVPIAFVLGA